MICKIITQGHTVIKEQADMNSLCTCLPSVHSYSETKRVATTQSCIPSAAIGPHSANNLSDDQSLNQYT